MRDGVGVGHFEAAFLQVLAVIDRRAADEKCALRVDYHAHLRGLDENVAIRRPIDQIHFVLQTGTSAANDCHSERALWTTLSMKQLRELGGGASSYLHQTLVPDLVLHFSRCRHPRIWNLHR